MLDLFLYISIILSQTIQFSISMQFKCQNQLYFKQFNLAKYIFFIYTQLNGKTVVFQTIQFSINVLFKCQTILFDPCYHSGIEWTWEQWQGRGAPHFHKFQHYWNLTIRLFSVINRTLVEGVLLLCRDAVGVFYSPSRVGHSLGKSCPQRRWSQYILLCQPTGPSHLWIN